jgi:predicted nicotinamide N-methyase
MDPDLFVRRNTEITRPPLVPEIALHLASKMTPIWLATEEELSRGAVPPPFWAFAWAGGQALARYLLDNPETVAGREVLDIGSGSGIVAIAAAMAGASRVVAAEIDHFAAAAISLNAALNGVTVAIDTRDLLDRGPAGWGVALAGDICYEEPMSPATDWRCSAIRAGPTCRGRDFLSWRVTTFRRPASSKIAKRGRGLCGKSWRRRNEYCAVRITRNGPGYRAEIFRRRHRVGRLPCLVAA